MPHFCTECGAPLDAGAQFCAACGHTTATPGTGATDAASETRAGDPAQSGTPPVATPGDAGRGGARRGWLVGLAIVLVAALVGGAVYWFAGREESASAGELFLEPASSEGADPFTGSTVTGTGSGATVPTVTGATVTTTSGGAVTTRLGSEVGLYGGTLDETSCDVEQQIRYLQENADKAAAFAGVLGITRDEIPAYLRTLTPVLLRYDTRVTNHGFVDGAATERQSVLQAGTAVLVDEYGVPRVRCRCGNPLTPPVALRGDVTTVGDGWPGYGPGSTVVVRGGETTITVFVLVDVTTGLRFQRPAGTDGSADVSGGDQLTGLCGATPDDTVFDLLAARRAGDRVAAGTCASATVVDYLFRLSATFVDTLRAREACRPASEAGLGGVSADAAACPLTNNAILIVERSQPRTDAGWVATQVVLVEQPPGTTTGTTSTTGATASCTQPWTTAAGGAAQTLVAYFRAIDSQDYATAFGLLSTELQAGWASAGTSDGLGNFSAFMRRYVRCVRLTGLRTVANPSDPEVSASLGIQWYAVDLDAVYRESPESTGGVFAPYYKVRSDPHTGEGRPPDLILETATGL